jgi:hypothetical protein
MGTDLAVTWVTQVIFSGTDALYRFHWLPSLSRSKIQKISFANRPPVDESRANRESPLKWTQEPGQLAHLRFQPLTLREGKPTMGFID